MLCLTYIDYGDKQMASVVWTRKALKQLSKIAFAMRPVIAAETELLSDYKSHRSVKALTNHKYDYRLRVRDYRVMFNVNGDVAEIVSIEEVKKRDESTY